MKEKDNGQTNRQKKDTDRQIGKEERKTKLLSEIRSLSNFKFR
jgi:hypothetical protein